MVAAEFPSRQEMEARMCATLLWMKGAQGDLIGSVQRTMPRVSRERITEQHERLTMPEMEQE